MVYSKDDIKRILAEIRSTVNGLDGEVDSYTVLKILKKLKEIEKKL